MSYKRIGEKILFDFYRWTRKISGERKRINEFKKKPDIKPLTKDQEKQVRAFYKNYKIPNMIFHSYFTDRSGVFYPEYIPQDIYVGYIDPYYNDVIGAKFLDNKCLYDMIFHGIPQCETILKRTNGIWLTGDNVPLDNENTSEIISNEKNGVFVKEAQLTAGGNGVTYIPQEKLSFQKVREITDSIKTDVVIQRELRQHPDMSLLNNSSINTLRMYSILGRDGEVTVYSSVVRMGIDGGKLDNYSAGGLTCGIQENGSLRKYGYNKAGERMTEHPTSHTIFEGFVIPSYDEAVALVKKAHPMVAHYRSIDWDIAIREDGTPVLIEANLSRGGIDSLQVNNGPLYGADTRKILDEVFNLHRE